MIIIASDIHGSAKWCKALVDYYHTSGASKLLLLGDILYHGPRNDLPEEYSPKAVIGLLNPLSHSIECVRGNCDAEVDDMVLDFPVLRESVELLLEGVHLYLAHGHHPIPELEPGTVVLTGHTHVPLDEVENGIRHLNPGSVSIPKENSTHSILVLDSGKFTFVDLE